MNKIKLIILFLKSSILTILKIKNKYPFWNQVCRKLFNYYLLSSRQSTAERFFFVQHLNLYKYE